MSGVGCGVWVAGSGCEGVRAEACVCGLALLCCGPCCIQALLPCCPAALLPCCPAASANGTQLLMTLHYTTLHYAAPQLTAPHACCTRPS